MSVMILLVLSLIGIVNAVGISQAYHNENPVIISPGETKSVDFGRFVASQETIDRVMEVEIIEGSEIVSIVDNTIEVPAGSIDTAIVFSISVPEDVEIGREYNIKIKIKDVTPLEADGMIGFSDSMTGNFPVSVQEPVDDDDEDTGFGMMWWLLGGLLVVIIVVIVIYFVVSRKKNGEEVVKPVKSGVKNVKPVKGVNPGKGVVPGKSV